MVATATLQLIKWKFKIWLLDALATFKLFSSHKWLVATLMDSADTEYFHHHRKERCLEYAKFKENFSSQTAIPLRPLYCLQGETPFSQLSQIRLFSMCVDLLTF